MPRIPRWRRYARLLGPDPAADVEAELRFHIESKIDELIANGWQAPAARIEAERQFGNLHAVRDTGQIIQTQREHHMDRKDFWGGCRQDLIYTLRTLRKERGFAAITILILALGIAANTAVFSVVNTVLLRPLPFPQSERLAWFTSGRDAIAAGRDRSGLSGITYTVAAWEEFQRFNQSFESVGSYNPFLANSEFTLTGVGEPLSVSGVMVSSNFFPTLGVQPVRGRLFTPEECRKGGPGAVLIRYSFWQRQFAGDPAITGKPLVISRQPYTVVGVLHPTFDFGAVFAPGENYDLFVPAIMEDMRSWGNTLALVGRLKPGVTVARAQSEADIVFTQIKNAHKDWWGDYSSNITGLKDYVSGKLRRSLIALWSAVGLILLIVCVNLSNLLLARSAARGKEFAVRSALGAGRPRLVRQLLMESLVLSSAGAVLGLVLAIALTRWLANQGSIALPLLTTVRVDTAALLWTLLLSAGVALVFGIAPAFNLSSGNLQGALKQSGAGLTSGRAYERLRAAMVVSEVALACVLLVGAGLLLRSFLRVLDLDLGFQPSRAAVVRIDYDGSDKPETRGPALQAILDAVAALPGVEAVGAADMLPLGHNRSWGFSAKGKTYKKGATLNAVVRVVTPGYLRAMGIRLTAGRDFNWQDTPKSERVVVINQSAARRFWQGEDALNRQAKGNGDPRVIGIVADVREHSLEESIGPEIYFSVTQAGPAGAELVVRSKLDPSALAPAVMKTLRTLNPIQPASEFRPLQQIVDRSASPRRFFVLLVGSFAALGLILASLGIYGVISYWVTRQTQEIGIRMALGATAPQVQRAIVAKALRLSLIGVALGSVGSLLTASWIESLLFGTRPTDPATFAGIALLLLAAALLAGYIPARRASHIDPMIALRTS